MFKRNVWNPTDYLM